MDYSVIADSLDSAVSSLTSNLDSLNGISFDGVWNGKSASKQTSDLKTALYNVERQKNIAKNFSGAMRKLQTYKDNKSKIVDLNSDKKSSDVEGAAEYNSEIDKKISALESQNGRLRREIGSLLNITSVNTQFDIVTYTPDETYKEYVVD